MRLNRILTSLIGVTGACLVTLPAKGARLQAWQFDASQNRLTFTTEAGVQPQAQFLTNPNRLVVDLPGIAYDQPAAQKLGGGAVTAVRVRQYDPETTRLEMELNPDYAIGPEDIRVWGITPQRWIIQLQDHRVLHNSGPLPPLLKKPTPSEAPPSHAPQLPQLPRESTQAASKQVSTAYQIGATQLQQIIATPEGFFVQTTGPSPAVQVYRSRDRNNNPQIVMDLLNTSIAQTSITGSLPRHHLGVAWSVTQFPTAPPAVRLTMSLAPNGSDWQVTPLGQGGIVLIPAGPIASPARPAAQRPQNSPQLPQISTATPTGNQVATVPAATQTAPSPSSNQQRLTVVLDAGHGGIDPGAVGIGGLQEKRVVMAITQHAAAALEAAGVAVVLTRQGDESVDLQPRVAIAEAAQGDLFVSIHANAVNMGRPDVNGVETYYYSERGAALAQILHRQVMQRVNMGDRGIKQARFFVLRRTSMPAVLIETGFVTGAIDAPLLQDPGWQATMGEAIAEGILTYIRQR